MFFSSQEKVSLETHVACAQLSHSHYYPGHILNGVIKIQLLQNPKVVSNELNIHWIAIQIHGHVSVHNDTLPVPILNTRVASLSVDEIASRHPSHANILHNKNKNPMVWLSSENQKDPISSQPNLPDIASFSGDKGSCIYMSKPYFICKENSSPLPLDRPFAIPLSKNLCPSYKGKSSSVFYFLSIFINASYKCYKTSFVRTIHVPFHVFSSNYSFERTIKLNHVEEENIQPTALQLRNINIENLMDQQEHEEVTPKAVQYGIESPFRIWRSFVHGRVETEEEKMDQTSILVIRMNEIDDPLADLILYKKNYIIGDTIMGTFRFHRKKGIQCSQICIGLFKEELIQENENEKDNSVRVIDLKVVDTFYQGTGDVTVSTFYLHLPVDETPTIDTDLTSFRWSLHFLFHISESNETSSSQENFYPPTFRAMEWEKIISVKIPPLPKSLSNNTIVNIPSTMYQGIEKKQII